MRFNIYIYNPLTIYLRWLYQKTANELRQKKLYIGYLSEVKNCHFGEYVTIGDNCVVVGSSIGRYTYVSSESKVYNTAIGKFCSVGSELKVGLGIHPTTFISTHPIFYSLNKQAQITFSDENYFQEHKNITIGNDVWIGTRVTIIDGVSIGDGVIIAAGSVVTKDVESYSIVGGVPAKHIKYRFDSEMREKLDRFKWWDKDIDWIKENAHAFRDKLLFNQLLDNEYRELNQE